MRPCVTRFLPASIAALAALISACARTVVPVGDDAGDATSIDGTDASAPDNDLRRVTTGAGFSCAIDSAGAVACWGDNSSGALGDGTHVMHPLPIRVPLPEPATTVSAGLGCTCASVASGALYCWGDASQQLGLTQPGNAIPPTVVALDAVTAVSSGYSFTCALRVDGSVWCWGANGARQLGDGPTQYRSGPRPVPIPPAQAISLGGAHACAILTDRSVMCWGDNIFGQLGEGTTDHRFGPVRPPLQNVVSIACGDESTCAVLADGTARCWGSNSSGQLGVGTIDTRRHPNPEAVDGAGFVRIAMLSATACALDARGETRCWGRNVEGQIGDGTVVNRPRPTLVPGVPAFVGISAGALQSCGATASGAVWCWGSTSSDGLGNGVTMTTIGGPTEVRL